MVNRTVMAFDPARTITEPGYHTDVVTPSLHAARTTRLRAILLALAAYARTTTSDADASAELAARMDTEIPAELWDIGTGTTTAIRLYHHAALVEAGHVLSTIWDNLAPAPAPPCSPSPPPPRPPPRPSTPTSAARVGAGSAFHDGRSWRNAGGRPCLSTPRSAPTASTRILRPAPIAAAGGKIDEWRDGKKSPSTLTSGQTASTLPPGRNQPHGRPRPHSARTVVIGRGPGGACFGGSGDQGSVHDRGTSGG
jgi:hypothetical protein